MSRIPTDAWILRRIRAVSLRRLLVFGLGLLYLVPAALRGESIILLALVFALLFGWKGVPAWRYTRNPSAHPQVRRITSWGNLLVVSAAIEREFRSPRYKGARGWKVGHTYVVQSTFLMFDVLRLEDLLWVYKKITRRSVNLIPIGTTHEVILAWEGRSVAMSGEEELIDEILDFARQRVPWVVVGYTNAIATRFKHKRPEFVRAVERVRAQWERQVTGARP